MKKLAAIGALGFLASGLFAQGLNTGGQTKDDWEEINFEFNSSILSDGYPSLLRLADLLSQHRDYKVKVTGHTDYVGSAAYNDKLALRRADAVKAFLVKYGVGDAQVTTSGDGKRSPIVDNKTKEGRFMNRRVDLAVTDGSGRLIKEGGIGDVINSLMSKLDDMAKKQQECCDQILKKLDKLDDILAQLKTLQGDNAKLQSQVDDLRNQHNALKDQVAGLPKPLTSSQTQDIAHTEALGAVDESQRRNKKFSVVSANIGPTYGAGRTGNFTFSGRGQFFSPFGGDGTRAVQAQGEYMYYPGRQEGQFDIGLVNRWGSIQAGAFGSFKYLNFKGNQQGGGLGQAAFLFDYVFSRGRIGIFGTQGFKNTAILNSVQLGPQSFLQTYAQIVNQYGGSALVGVWGNAYIEGNLAYLRNKNPNQSDAPGGSVRLVQPLNEHVAFTAEAGFNETLLNTNDSGRVVFGLQLGNYIHPKDYGKTKSPVPMDVPRVRYQLLTRRLGNSPPVANAGPDQVGVPGGTVTLDGSASYDPDNDPITYQWTQIGGNSVTLATPTAAKTTFTAVAGQTYIFKLTVTDTGGLSSSATTRVTATTPATATIVRFDATPNQISAGQSSTLTWIVQGATSVSINNGIGNVAASGSTTVSPTATTTYTLTAVGPNGNVTANAIVTVGAGGTTSAQIIRFEGNPLSIQPGQQSTLSWTTTGATQVSISGVGAVTPNGSTTVTPTQTTTYTLSATGSDGKTVTAPITITVASGTVPQVVVFVATPQNIDAGSSTKLCWQVTGATSISIQPGVGSNLNANDCATVSPTATTTYTLTATNATGQIQANATVNVGTVRITSFTADPVTSTAAGSPVTLSWTTENATSVVLIGSEIGPQTLPANGTFVIHPITNSTYTLTAYGNGGQTVSATISVFVR
uniref:OmpA/MotB domain protein n=1 Tax=Solibacter usitatus (strain Ellin6076) TaxID=234267 RepID=Q01Z63_SOLUE